MVAGGILGSLAFVSCAIVQFRVNVSLTFNIIAYAYHSYLSKVEPVFPHRSVRPFFRSRTTILLPLEFFLEF